MQAVGNIATNEGVITMVEGIFFGFVMAIIGYHKDKRLDAERRLREAEEEIDYLEERLEDAAS
jgi:hypothetical protein